MIETCHFSDLLRLDKVTFLSLIILIYKVIKRDIKLFHTIAVNTHTQFENIALYLVLFFLQYIITNNSILGHILI